MNRPKWLTEVIAAFGQPEIDYSGPVRIGDGESTSCWVWFVAGENHNAGITRIRGDRYEVTASGPGRTATLHLGDEPTDDDMRALCAAVWPALRPGGSG